MISQAVRNENIKKLRELIGDIPVAMLTTVDEQSGRLRARPVATQRKPFDGTLWFFVKMPPAASPVETDEKRAVAVSYQNDDKNLFISVTGTATYVRDLHMMEEMWFSDLSAWFPDALDDPDLGLIRIEVDDAEYWDGPDNAVERLAGFVRAFRAGETYQENENEELRIQ